MSKALSEIQPTVVHEITAPFVPERTIVIPVDGSEYSEYAVSWYLSKFKQAKDHVILLNVRPLVFQPIDLDIDSPFIPSDDELAEQASITKRQSAELLLKYIKELENNGVYVSGLSLCGDARHELTRKINEYKADAVIIGKRGLGLLSELVIGSVSIHLIHHLKVPVIVLDKHNKA